MFCVLRRRELAYFSKNARSGAVVMSLLRDAQGSALLEFAISLPLLVVFVVGIYDFSGAFNQKQKIAQAAQGGAIIAGAQPMSDIQASDGNPESLQAVAAAVFNSLAGSGVLPNANQVPCAPPGTASGPAGLAWTYTISGCSGAYPADDLIIVINRASVSPGPPAAVCTVVTVTYPYHWLGFNRVIQLVVPGASYADTLLTESATVHNQM
jgi:Flp pilus assembly protein TadG